MQLNTVTYNVSVLNATQYCNS